VRPAGGAHPVVCVGPWGITPGVRYSDVSHIVIGTLYCERALSFDEMLNQGPDALWSLKNPGCPSKKE